MGASRNLFIFVFLFISACVLFFPDEILVKVQKSSTEASGNKGVTDQVFKQASYYSFNQVGENTKIDSEKIVHEGEGGKITLSSPSGEILSKQGKIDYYGSYGEIFPKNQSVHLYNGVSFKGEGIDVKSEEMVLDQQKGDVKLFGQVRTDADLDKGDKLVLQSSKAFFNKFDELISYQGQVKGKITFEDKIFSKPLLFTSNTLKYFSNIGEIKLSEDVTLKRGSVDIQARKGQLFLKKKKKGIRYFILEDDVKFKEKFLISSGKTITRTGISQRLEGFGFDQKIVFSGYPRIKQLDDLIRGNEIIIRQKSELIEIINTNSKFKFEENN